VKEALFIQNANELSGWSMAPAVGSCFPRQDRPGKSSAAPGDRRGNGAQVGFPIPPKAADFTHRKNEWAALGPDDEQAGESGFGTPRGGFTLGGRYLQEAGQGDTEQQLAPDIDDAFDER